jgi:hypothetical protein
MPRQQPITRCIAAQCRFITRYFILADTISMEVDGCHTMDPGLPIVEVITTGRGVGILSSIRSDKVFPNEGL